MSTSMSMAYRNRPSKASDPSMLSRIIGSLTFTIPSVAYLIQPQFKKGSEDAHGHGHHNPDDKGGPVHDTEPGDLVPNLRKSESDDGDDEQDEASNEDAGDKTEESSDEPSSQSEGGQETGTPDTSDDEESQDTAHETDSGENVEGVQFKGATSGGSREGEQGDTRKHIPDAKGGSKKRIESDYGRPQGIAGDDNLEKDESGKTMDKVCHANSISAESIDVLLACHSENLWGHVNTIRQARRTIKYGHKAFNRHRE